MAKLFDRVPSLRPQASTNSLSRRPEQQRSPDNTGAVDKVASHGSPESGNHYPMIAKVTSLGSENGLQAISSLSAARTSHRRSGLSDILDQNPLAVVLDELDRYGCLIKEAKRCIGYGSEEGSFPEEWDAQLLVDGGRTPQGHRLVIFTPAFLKPLLHDERELDRAFKFILLAMDGVAMKEKYVFVYCHSGMDWTNPQLAHRLRVAFDILPNQYAKHLRKFYILHPTAGLRLSMGFVWAWLSSRVWSRIEYASCVSTLGDKLELSGSTQRAEFRRHFPQLVQRVDSTYCGEPPPLTFGVPLTKLCDGFGVDFTDKTTGRWYPRLPPALVFLCEALERQDADEAFGSLFSADAVATYDLVAVIDEGEPLEPDVPLPALWCALKLFIDCLPVPLLGFQAFGELTGGSNCISKDTGGSQAAFLVRMLRNIPSDAAYMALYLASFLHTMCEGAKQRERRRITPTPHEDVVMLTPQLAAEVFASGFLRPKIMSESHLRKIPPARRIVEAFIIHAEDEEIWVGHEPVPPTYDVSTSSVGSSELSD